MRKNNSLYKQLTSLWNQLSKLEEMGVWDDDTISMESKLLDELEHKLPFESKEEHLHWLEVMSSYKFWEDWEELNMRIINRAATPKKDDIIRHCYEVLARDVCEDANFIDLFNTFAKLSTNWVKLVSKGWDKWWKHISQNQDYLDEFLNEYKTLYGKEYKREDLAKEFYGFETTTQPRFYANDKEGKEDLLECIFERYVYGLDEDEELDFYKAIIKELI